MIKNLLSRYHLRYVRSLVYMLQASEYRARDYLRWYHRTRDFAHVERRGHLVKTAKSQVLLIASWLVVLFFYHNALVILFFDEIGPVWRLLTSLAIVISLPYLLAYLVIAPLGIISLLQLPVEYWIVRVARRRLAQHKGMKIAIAGSFGKTSMREILRVVLSEGKKVAACPHSYNTLIGISRFIRSLGGDEEVLIFELGEYYPGDIRALCDLVRPEWGVITGVN